MTSANACFSDSAHCAHSVLPRVPPVNPLRGKCLLEGYTRVEAALAPGRERDEIDVDMRRRFVHMDVRGVHPQIRVAFLKSAVVFVQHLLRQLTVFRSGAHIVHIAYLHYDLMKQLFLVTCPDLLIVIGDDAVLSFLLGVVTLKRFVEEFVINLFEGFIDVTDVVSGAGAVNILRDKTAVVVPGGALPDHCADGSFHKH